MSAALLSKISFRDPDGVLEHHEDKLLRLLRPEAAERFERVLQNPVVAALMKRGDVVSTWPAHPQSCPASWREVPGTIYEHERIPFVSYAYEWSPAMLADAARFTLELCLKLLPAGLMLKDATPANILFRGSRPVLVDVPSIAPREQGSFLWLARQQFETCFLLPLVLSVECGVPLAWSLQDPVSGVSHPTAARLLGVRRWTRPSLIAAVALPAALSDSNVRSGHGALEPKLANDDRAVFTLQRTFDGLLSKVNRLARRVSSRNSHWRGYSSQRQHYSEHDLELKRDFVRRALAHVAPRTVLDVGANTGEFSREAAARGARVVAVDTDETSVSEIFTAARTSSADILPLVMDFARPTSANGWANEERSSFLHRATQHFDLVLMLAVVHHLRVTSGIPLAAVVDLAARLTRKALLVEFVPRTDPMFTLIARGREDLYTDYSEADLECRLRQGFRIDMKESLPNGRTLYLATRS